MLDPLKVDSYDYHLPSHLIAKEPVQPADMAKLLVYDRKTDTITHTVFKNLPNFLPQKTHIIFNDTKVIKARIFGHKSSGGKIELLINRPLENDRFNVFIRGKVKVGTELEFSEGLQAKVEELGEDGTRIVTFYHNDKRLSFHELLPILDHIGLIPLPPYIDRAAKKEDEKNYQPIFAKKAGAVAAPTASLHFTEQMLNSMQKKFPFHFVTLHVGAGTFKPVETTLITEHAMHSEYYEIPKETIQVIESDKKILAVGTTVTRTIEYFVRTKKSFGECDLFLHPLNRPKRVDYLLTNFHLPKSTLIMLVASFIGLETTKRVYQEAIEKEYRFYSYGDAMLIL
ncbi:MULTISPECIES: tRNA preQ1(34) S-adenosylmethionine ribosyltransferase-isomerase QueA [unclassified Nitratiruptor]|uniref:tRNA preQ1(34) S-adenosylmethionine ribosyltransferase-isomerase QueA n=1 Tax=unclassified Nitratiruptor TaxID=2624044 RepID=UPI0019154529|nr:MULTISPECIES: tRNA preQ1(34) S-adenosylmethionine ribosyltransferase-isomerase QueA [unclassified Nitratiruptor]BCD60131.1 S-adenosylmethionine:tRNA ribosyltransferase-isomerase [Nitratiruptor sp. YY08-10]BCD64380.1 S-adenosylmethionine:tRNA ribosyltransferase-isomerase [Nitratiruptor sp. YY08-14]